jgi:protease I
VSGHSAAVDATVAEALDQQFDALALPGGVANPDRPRTLPDAVRFTRAITSWPSSKTDLMNAGAEWVDEDVRVDRNGPNTLVSRRKPDDLPAFNRPLGGECAARRAGARA